MRAPHCSVLSSAKYVCSQVCVSPCPSAPPRTRSYEDGQKPAAAGSVQNASLPFGAGTHEPESSAFQADSTVVHLIAFPHVRVCVCVYARTHAHTRACVHACMRACTHCAQRAWPACDATVIFVLWWACSSRCPARTKKGDAHHPHGTHCTFLPESSFGSCVHSWHTRRRGPSRKARARPRSTRRAACAPGTHARTCSWKHSRQSPASRHRGRPWPPTRASCSPSTTRMHARHLRAAPPPTIASPEIFVLCSWDETTNQLPVPWYVDVPRGFQLAPIFFRASQPSETEQHAADAQARGGRRAPRGGARHPGTASKVRGGRAGAGVRRRPGAGARAGDGLQSLHRPGKLLGRRLLHMVRDDAGRRGGPRAAPRPAPARACATAPAGAGQARLRRRALRRQRHPNKERRRRVTTRGACAGVDRNFPRLCPCQSPWASACSCCPSRPVWSATRSVAHAHVRASRKGPALTCVSATCTSRECRALTRMPACPEKGSPESHNTQQQQQLPCTKAGLL